LLCGQHTPPCRPQMGGGSTGKAAAPSVKKGGSKDAAKGTSRGSAFPSGGRKQKWELEPKWVMDVDFKPPRKISDKELEQARKMFFELDRDGSGSIDAQELSVMFTALGQSPTEDELNALIASVDDGDKDGQIQLREFLKLYTESLDNKKKGGTGADEVNQVFASFGADPSDPASRVAKSHLQTFVLEEYDLDVDIDGVFGKVSGPDLSKEDFDKLLLSQPA